MGRLVRNTTLPKDECGTQCPHGDGKCTRSGHSVMTRHKFDCGHPDNS